QTEENLHEPKDFGADLQDPAAAPPASDVQAPTPAPHPTPTPTPAPAPKPAPTPQPTPAPAPAQHGGSTSGAHRARLTGRHDRLSGGPGNSTPAPAPGASANQPGPPPPRAALAIKSEATAPAASGAGSDRFVVGVGEEVKFSSVGGESGTWTASGG